MRGDGEQLVHVTRDFRGNKVWTEQDHELLKRMWVEQGRSATEIGKVFGVTRNSILGLCHRKGWKKEISASVKAMTAKVNGAQGWRPKARVRRVKKEEKMNGWNPSPTRTKPPKAPMTSLVLAFDRDHGGEGVELANLKTQDCRWPIGGQRADTRFCGVRRAHDKTSYCTKHLHEAWRKPR